MSRIAAGAGIRQASLYSHFQSRHEILLAALDVIYEKIYASRDDPLQREHPRASAGDVRPPSGAVGRPGRATPRPAPAGVRRGGPGEGLRETLAAKHLETLRGVRPDRGARARRRARSRRTWTPSRWPGSSPAWLSRATCRHHGLQAFPRPGDRRSTGWTSCSPASWRRGRRRRRVVAGRALAAEIADRRGARIRRRLDERPAFELEHATARLTVPAPLHYYLRSRFKEAV